MSTSNHHDYLIVQLARVTATSYDYVKEMLGAFVDERIKKQISKEEEEEQVFSHAINIGREQAALLCEEWGRVAGGGDGEMIIPSGPNKGQRYGEVFFNLANSIRKLKQVKTP